MVEDKLTRYEAIMYNWWKECFSYHLSASIHSHWKHTLQQEQVKNDNVALAVNGGSLRCHTTPTTTDDASNCSTTPPSQLDPILLQSQKSTQMADGGQQFPQGNFDIPSCRVKDIERKTNDSPPSSSVSAYKGSLFVPPTRTETSTLDTEEDDAKWFRMQLKSSWQDLEDRWSFSPYSWQADHFAIDQAISPSCKVSSAEVRLPRCQINFGNNSDALPGKQPSASDLSVRDCSRDSQNEAVAASNCYLFFCSNGRHEDRGTAAQVTPHYCRGPKLNSRTEDCQLSEGPLRGDDSLAMTHHAAVLFQKTNNVRSECPMYESDVSDSSLINCRSGDGSSNDSFVANDTSSDCRTDDSGGDSDTSERDLGNNGCGDCHDDTSHFKGDAGEYGNCSSGHSNGSDDCNSGGSNHGDGDDFSGHGNGDCSSDGSGNSCVYNDECESYDKDEEETMTWGSGDEDGSDSLYCDDSLSGGGNDDSEDENGGAARYEGVSHSSGNDDDYSKSDGNNWGFGNTDTIISVSSPGSNCGREPSDQFHRIEKVRSAWAEEVDAERVKIEKDCGVVTSDCNMKCLDNSIVDIGQGGWDEGNVNGCFAPLNWQDTLMKLTRCMGVMRDGASTTTSISATYLMLMDELQNGFEDVSDK